MEASLISHANEQKTGLGLSLEPICWRFANGGSITPTN